MANAVAVVRRGDAAAEHDIPSLDGLRAIAIAIVVLSHTKSLMTPTIAQSGLFRYLIGGGLHGVQIFFVISGYLITILLLRELNRTGSVSLSRFYVRRALRIFPPFYLYLGVIALLWVTGLHLQDGSTFLSAASYTIIYHPNPKGWMLQHAWSLSIEEQFYLLWPAMLVFAFRRGVARRAAVLILILMPIARGVVEVVSRTQAADHQRLIVNISSIDMLVTGCLLALLATSSRWRAWCERWITGRSALCAVVLGFVVLPYAGTKLTGTAVGAYALAFGYSATACAIGSIVEYTVRNPESIAGQILNLSPIRHIGVISYSVYLWQQIFTSNPARFGWMTYVLIFVTAEASYWLLERPLIRVRARFNPGLYSPARAEHTNSPARLSVSGASPNASIQ